MFTISRCAERLGLCAGLLLVLAGSALQAEPRRVLIIHSFGREFAPFDTMSSTFRTELARQSPEPVEFYEASIETARFTLTPTDGPLLAYLNTLFVGRRLDLIVTIAEPATEFYARNRREFFPQTPLLAHIDYRALGLLAGVSNAVAAEVHVDLPVLVENIQRACPDTTNVVMVLGASPFESIWAQLCRQDFAPFTNRIHFTFVDDLPLEQIRKSVSRLPPHSAVLYGMLAVDAAGVPYEQEQALRSIHAAANAPLFGVFESQLGQGIVGGKLLSLDGTGKNAAAAAVRLLRGESAASIGRLPPVPPRVIYDWRELQRWKIPESRLFAGGELRFRVPTFWEEYKWQLIGIHAVCLVEGVLIFALLRNRRRLRRTQQELRNSEERLSLATNSARVGVWSYNLQTGGIEATAECKQLFGYRADEPVDFAKFIARVHPDDRAPVQAAISEAVRAKKVYDTQYRIRLPDGTLRWIAARGSSRAAQAGGTEMLGVVLDITERKQSEAEVQRHRQELAHVSRVSIMGELSASMAHELNQPLTAVLTNAQAAQRFLAAGHTDMAEFREILKDIAHDTTRARDVIRHLRALVKKSAPEFTRLDLAGVIREVAGFLNGDSVARNVRVALELPPDLPPVLGDRVQLQQVIINLLLNAFEAMNNTPVAERVVTVALILEAPQSLRVTVRDCGSGIAAERLDAIFDPFFTTKTEGMGMGLSVTRTIIEAHAGRIWAENNPDRGATLHFTVPVAEPR
jgi:PAS domain S-box-containing protein